MDGGGFFIFVLYGGYLLGNLKRINQLLKRINRLRLQIADKQIAQQKLQQSEQRMQKQTAAVYIR